MAAPLRLNDVVVIRDTPRNREDHIAGLRGVIAGTSQAEETGEIVAYAVWLSHHERVWMLDAADLAPTGERDLDGVPMSGQSIRVNQHGQVVSDARPADP